MAIYLIWFTLGNHYRLFAGSPRWSFDLCFGHSSHRAGLHPGDAYQQTRAILARIEAVLREAGSSLNDIVQTRLYLRDITRWEEAGRAHGEIFREIRPATSMVEVSRFLDPNMLVEIEAIAVLSAPAGEENLC